MLVRGVRWCERNNSADTFFAFLAGSLEPGGFILSFYGYVANGLSKIFCPQGRFSKVWSERNFRLLKHVLNESPTQILSSIHMWTPIREKMAALSSDLSFGGAPNPLVRLLVKANIIMIIES